MKIRRTFKLVAPLAAILPAFFALVGVGLAGCATDRQVVAQSDQENQELAPAVIQDAEIKSYLDAMGKRIVDAAKEADQQHAGPSTHFKKGEDNAWMFEGWWQSKDAGFHLVNSKTLNAFTTGGNHLYIYSQLMETCRTEDELAAVMSHEYAHVYSRHVAKGMNRQYYGLGAAVGAGLVGLAVGGKEHGLAYGSMAAVSAGTVSQFLSLGYTRGDEAEADQWGFYFYSHAGWDPAHFGDFFQQLIDKGMDQGSELTSDHPSLSSRVQTAKKRAAELPPDAASWRKPPIADAAKFAALKARAAQIGATMKTSEQLAKAQTLLSAVPSCVTPEDQPDQKNAQKRLADALQAGEHKPPPKP